MLSLDKLQIFNEKRLLILQRIFECENGLCGCDFVVDLKLPKNLVSYHIHILKENGIIEEHRMGRKVRYTIVEKYKDMIACILQFLKK